MAGNTNKERYIVIYTHKPVLDNTVEAAAVVDDVLASQVTSYIEERVDQSFDRLRGFVRHGVDAARKKSCQHGYAPWVPCPDCEGWYNARQA